ncbi:hypothetical protein [Absidia glauca]|uniref:Uncharacterized protein n=1 Tax=Absidia glauca TaxID=4829 RepID=A0A163JCP0_ABSGL|nr:hypothetical protein [Absidia glauca]
MSPSAPIPLLLFLAPILCSCSLLLSSAPVSISIYVIPFSILAKSTFTKPIHNPPLNNHSACLVKGISSSPGLVPDVQSVSVLMQNNGWMTIEQTFLWRFLEVLDQQKITTTRIRPGVSAVDVSSASPSHYIIGKARKENGDLVVDCSEIVSIEATRQTRLTPIAYPLNQVTTKAIIDCHV